MTLSFSPEVNDAIEKASARYGIDPMFLRVTAQLESGGNPNAKNPNSSAEGLYQFIDRTAQGMGLSDRRDPYASADAAARLFLQNQRQVGRDLSVAEGYLAHQQGGGGAAKLLRNPNARAVDVVGADAVKLNGGTADMTAGEFANLWLNKANKLAGGPVSQQPTAQQPAGPGKMPGADFMAAYKRAMGGDPDEAQKEELTGSDKLAFLGDALTSLGTGGPAPTLPAQQDRRQVDLSQILDQMRGNPIFQSKKRGGFSL